MIIGRFLQSYKVERVNMDYSKIKPLNGIIVLKVASTKQSAGGIHYVDPKRLDHATVVAIGPGEWTKKKGKTEFNKVDVRVGDVVVIGPGSGALLEVEIDGETDDLTFLSENDIVAIVRK